MKQIIARSRASPPATILGDGRVALIIDVDTVVAMRRRERMPDPSLYAAE
ncbi:MAG: hypothetical protein WDM79_04100 [Terricaulis sp.]